MVNDAIRKFYEEYYVSAGFRFWQNELARDIYKELVNNTKPDKLQEVAKLSALCGVMSHRRYSGLTIQSRKVHGYSTSGVEFDYMGKKIKKELADMVIISMVTFDRRIVMLKTALIQNKDSKVLPDRWYVDQGQLFLLQNFPTFTGTSGVFKGETSTFLNHSGTLGNYGLFLSNGDLAVLTARNIFCGQQSGGYIDFSDIKNGSRYQHRAMRGIERIRSKGSCDLYKCSVCKYYGSFGCSLNYESPFFGTYNFALGVHEVVRNLTYFNIGEPVSEFGRIIDNELYHYTDMLLRFSFGYSIGENYFNKDNRRNDNEYGIDISVVLNHLELHHEY